MSKQRIVTLYLIISCSSLFLFEFISSKVHLSEGFVILLNYIVGLAFIFVIGRFLYVILSKQEKYKELQKEGQLLQTMINSMVDFVNFKDGEGKWIKVNDFGLKLFQLEHVDYQGKKDSELALYSDFFYHALHFCEASDENTWLRKEVTREEEIIPLPDGDQKIFDTIKVPIFNGDGSRKALVVLGRDITERVKAEKRLSESRQQYKSLFDYNPDAMLMADLNGNVTNVNPGFEQFTGFLRKEIVGKSIVGLIENQTDQQKVMDAYLQVINKRTSVSFEDIRILTKEGQFKLLNATFVPMLIKDEIVGIISYSKDVTHLRETEERLRKSEKLSIVGELAASVAHEVRNPLTALKGFVQLLKTSDNKHDSYYNIMSDELDRINLIASELLVLGKPQEIQFTRLDIVQLLEDVRALLEAEANMYNANISIHVHHPVPYLSCEANQLKQVFINIIKNSIEASARDISIEFTEKDQWVFITIKDDGHGIDQNRIENLGEPFYSSKEKGTGLGLTISYRIIETHGGKITFYSEVGKGTIVKIGLPVHEADNQIQQSHAN
jgi:PAS domain S-box-containing protein